MTERDQRTTGDPNPNTDQIPVQTDVRVPPQAGNMPVPADQAPTETTQPHPFEQVRRTRASGLWITVTGAAVVLLVLLVFVINNGASVDIAFFGLHGHLSLGVALLLAAICGVLIVAIPGYGRILQLRRALRKSASS